MPILLLKKFWYIPALVLFYVLYRFRFGNGFYTPKNDNGTVLTRDEASNLAEILYSAMNKNGTDEQQIYAVMDSSTAADWNAIYNAFGSRHMSPEFGQTIPFLPEERYDLNQWVSNELTESEKDFVRTNFSHLKLF